jgi:hypothetical protein
LIGSRYKSKAVEVDEYFIPLIVYIHQNPMRAGIVEKLNETRDQLTKVKPPRQKIFPFKKYTSNKPLEIANIFTKGE